MLDPKGIAMAAIRAVLVTVSPLLGDIVTTLLANRARLDLVARWEDRKDIETELVAISPDLVLIGLQAGETNAIACSLLVLVPSATVITLSGDGKTAYVHAMRAHCVPLGDVSPAVLLDVILQPPVCPGI
jgi:chemotaxis response regulator CheB